MWLKTFFFSGIIEFAIDMWFLLKIHYLIFSKIYFYHIHSHLWNPPRPLPPYPPKFMFFVSFKKLKWEGTGEHRIWIVLGIYSWAGACLEWGWLIINSSKENWFSPPRSSHLQITSFFFWRGRSQYQLCSFLLGTWSWVCVAQVCAITVSVSSDVHLPCWSCL